MDEITTYDDAIPLKSALENLLGSEEWYRLKDTRSVTVWRKSLLKALRSTDVAISASVQIADEGWRETAREILAIDPQAKLIVSSGYSYGSVMTNYKDYGFKAAIEKTFDRTEIVKVLAQVLSSN